MAFLAENRKARFDYQILESVEAGIELLGIEVKAIRAGQANLTGSFALIRGGELWLTNADIPPYQAKNTAPEYDPKKTRRLLVSKEEIQTLANRLQSEHLTIVPLKLYNKGGLIKIELGLARGKKKADKRETIKRRDVSREVGRRLKN